MPSDALDDQLDKYLADAHSIEEQALAQMRTAPDIAGEPTLAAAFAGHLKEASATSTSSESGSRPAARHRRGSRTSS
jgi:ferritin-like metal-binding protein YciE